MKKIIALFVLVLTGLIAVNAQTFNDFQDVIYLKDGSVIRGIIVEEVPNVSVKIKSGPNIFNYTVEQIEKFTRELIEEEKSGGIKDFGFKPKGFVANYELGLTHIVNGNTPMFSVILSHGYQVNPYFSAGLATGGEVSSQGLYNVPVYADLRVYMLKTRITPYFNLGFGYNLMISRTSNFFSTSTSVQHGILTAPATGIRIAINKKIAVGLGVGYKYIGIPTRTSNFAGTSTSWSQFHAVTLRTGITF